MGNTLEQAVREAIASERAAAGYFDALAMREVSSAGGDLCRMFAQQKKLHAERLERLACRLETGDLAHYAEIQIPATLVAPSFGSAADSSLEAFSIARAAAYRSAFFYDALVEASPTHAPLFRELAGDEEELAVRLDRLMRISASRRPQCATAS